MTVPDGRFPTQSAWPDCFGLRGGPLGVDGTLPELEPELTLLPAVATVSHDTEAGKGRLPGRPPGFKYAPGDPYQEYGITAPGG